MLAWVTRICFIGGCIGIECVISECNSFLLFTFMLLTPTLLAKLLFS